LVALGGIEGRLILTSYSGWLAARHDGQSLGVDASTLPDVLEGNAETSGVYQKAALRATGRPEEFALALC
jgi:hypothetical protein